MLGAQAFNVLSQGASRAATTGAKKSLTFNTVLKIRCKLSLEYLIMVVLTETIIRAWLQAGSEVGLSLPLLVPTSLLFLPSGRF